MNLTLTSFGSLTISPGLACGGRDFAGALGGAAGEGTFGLDSMTCGGLSGGGGGGGGALVLGGGGTKP